jgi:hypothetical protein
VDQILTPLLSQTAAFQVMQKPALPFCDNCPAHCPEEVLSKLTRRGILVITYPPHTSHIFQVLDGLLFGVLKQAIKHERRDDSLAVNVDRLLRLVRSYAFAMTSITIRSSWNGAGFRYEGRGNEIYLTREEGGCGRTQ